MCIRTLLGSSYLLCVILIKAPNVRSYTVLTDEDIHDQSYNNLSKESFKWVQSRF